MGMVSSVLVGNGNVGRPVKILLLALGFLSSLMAPGYAADEPQNAEALWQAVRSGQYVVLMRHALAPGTGDPANFAIDDCNTQRNLSDQGRSQAERIGARIRGSGIPTARVYSSQWCRCLETAERLELGPVEELESLNSFFRQPERRAATTQALKDWLADQPLDAPIVLVTHQVNITALTGVYPRSGEMIFVRRSEDGAVTVTGRIETE